MTQIVFKIKEPLRGWCILGYIGACFLPVIWGLAHLQPIIGYGLFGCEGAGRGSCRQLNRFFETEALMIPVYLTFVFGTMAAGVISVFRVKNTIHEISCTIEFGSIAMKSASWVHLVAGALHYIILIVFFGRLSPTDVSLVLLVFIVGICFHIIMWLLITLPLSFVCAMVFRCIAVKAVERP